MIALTADGSRVIAWEVEKGDGPYYCPQCGSMVVVKKGEVYVHHFAHKTNLDCPNAGESILHMEIKCEIYRALEAYPNCERCAMERVLDGVRPDISLYIGRVRVAIEVQLSPITEAEILRRMAEYERMEIFCLWVLNREDLFDKKTHKKYTKKWERFLHQLYLGRVYYWFGGARVVPTMFSFGGTVRKAWFNFRERSGRVTSLHIARGFEAKSAMRGFGSAHEPQRVCLWKDRIRGW